MIVNNHIIDKAQLICDIENGIADKHGYELYLEIPRQHPLYSLHLYQSIQIEHESKTLTGTITALFATQYNYQCPVLVVWFRTDIT